MIMFWNLGKEKIAVEFVAGMETSVLWKNLPTQKIIEDIVSVKRNPL